MAPPPPSPLIQGSSTPSANVVAITASTQSPPAASTSAPTCAAFPDCAATMPPLEVTAGLRIDWVLENWSRIGWPVIPCDVALAGGPAACSLLLASAARAACRSMSSLHPKYLGQAMRE